MKLWLDPVLSWAEKPFHMVLLFQEYYEAGYNPEDDLEYLLMEAE